MSQGPTKTLNQLAMHDVQPYLEAQDKLTRLIANGNSFSGNERHCAYLNVGESKPSRFANISAVSGFDFSDDGRGMAIVDWDFDGDLDFWLSNRTGPRLRFLRNKFAEKHGFVSFRLEGNGKSCNRDAIGARLELDVGATKLVRTLKAGEGYLSQSSKWVHFGLGDASEIGELRVRWPDNTEEAIQELKPNAHYTIQQGTLVARKWDPPTRPSAIRPGAVPNPETHSSTRVVLPPGVPLPALTYTDFTGRKRFVRDSLDQPLLLNLWATWCEPCVKEMREFEENQVHVLALNVEAVSKGEGNSNDKVRAFFERSGFSFRGGMIADRELRLLQSYHDIMLNDNRQLPIPTSFLIDTDGSVAAIYKGAVDGAILEADIADLTVDAARFRRKATPFAGRWLVEPPPASPYLLAERLIDNWALIEALDYIDQFIGPSDIPRLQETLAKIATAAQQQQRLDIVEQADLLIQAKLGNRLPPSFYRPQK